MFPVGVVVHGSELSPLQLRSAFRRLGYPTLPEESFELAAHHCLYLWAMMLLERLRFLAPEQRSLLHDELISVITPDLVAEIQSGALRTPMVVIADSRYATWHSRQGWLDLSNGETVVSPRVPPLETLAYNLAALFERNKTACGLIHRTQGARE